MTNTYQRSFLSNIRSDKVEEGSVGVYAENTVRWMPWLRTTLGWRGDRYSATVDSIFDANNSGHVQASLGSPKFSMVVGPFNKMELFFGAGMGMHSNDARGSTDPTSPSPIDGDLAVSHARFVGFDANQAALDASLAGFPQAQIGNAPGNFIPNAPAVIASALGEKIGWFGGLRWRYLGTTPLTEDNAFRSPVTSIINGRAGYHFDNGWTVQLDGLNLLNAKTNQITYAYGSLIKTDSLFNLCFPVQVAPAAVCQNGSWIEPCTRSSRWLFGSDLPRSNRNHNARWLGDAITVFSGMAIRRTWSVRSGIAYAVACCLVVQALIAGLHVAHAVDQQLTASDPSICHGGNGTPAGPHPDRADICCLLACNVSGQAAIPSELATVPRHEIAATIQLTLHSPPLLRSHLLDRSHSRPRSPPSA